MVMIIYVDVVSVEELIFLGLVEFVVLLGEFGELGILFGYMLLFICIKVGEVCFKLL